MLTNLVMTLTRSKRGHPKKFFENMRKAIRTGSRSLEPLKLSINKMPQNGPNGRMSNLSLKRTRGSARMSSASLINNFRKPSKSIAA